MNENLAKMAQFIFELRKEKNMTQKDLAEQLGVTDKAVSKWERGLSCPDISLLQKLCDVLGVTVGELLNGERMDASALEVDTLVETTLKYADAATKTAIAKSKGWKYAALISIILLLSIIVFGICSASIGGTIKLGVPIWLASLVWVSAMLGAFIMGKQKIASTLLCGFALFLQTYFYSSITMQPSRNIDHFEGFPQAYIPQYTVALILLGITVALVVAMLLFKKTAFGNSMFSVAIASATTIVMSALTIPSIINYVDLNFLSVDSRFVLLILATIGINMLLLAIIAKQYLFRARQKN